YVAKPIFHYDTLKESRPPETGHKSTRRTKIIRFKTPAASITKSAITLWRLVPHPVRRPPFRMRLDGAGPPRIIAARSSKSADRTMVDIG
ncbi:MAG: hypothetical protein VX431_01760, partial [Planctomycetota bacterium]|nr:hypothetical protein [Planctomycetota bacterium]